MANRIRTDCFSITPLVGGVEFIDFESNSVERLPLQVASTKSKIVRFSEYILKEVFNIRLTGSEALRVLLFLLMQDEDNN